MTLALLQCASYVSMRQAACINRGSSSITYIPHQNWSDKNSQHSRNALCVCWRPALDWGRHLSLIVFFWAYVTYVYIRLWNINQKWLQYAKSSKKMIKFDNIWANFTFVCLMYNCLWCECEMKWKKINIHTRTIDDRAKWKKQTKQKLAGYAYLWAHSSIHYDYVTHLTY